jgi:hypothetical protein
MIAKQDMACSPTTVAVLIARRGVPEAAPGGTRISGLLIQYSSTALQHTSFLIFTLMLALLLLVKVLSVRLCLVNRAVLMSYHVKCHGLPRQCGFLPRMMS